jgi:hypothetical protein
LQAGRSVTRAVVTEGRACNTIAVYVSVLPALVSIVMCIENDETAAILTVSVKMALQWFVLFGLAVSATISTRDAQLDAHTLLCYSA